MEYELRLTDRAFQDMRGIYEFIGAESSEVALAWFEKLVEAVESLSTYPERGTAVAGKKSVRRIIFGDKPNVYRIAYLVDKRNGVVHVLHVRHGARQE